MFCVQSYSNQTVVDYLYMLTFKKHLDDFLFLQLNRANGPPSPQPAPGTLGRVAAVGPYIQVPVPGRQEGGYTMPPDPLKPQTLSVNNQANLGRTKSGWLKVINASCLLITHNPRKCKTQKVKRNCSNGYQEAPSHLCKFVLRTYDMNKRLIVSPRRRGFTPLHL